MYHATNHCGWVAVNLTCADLCGCTNRKNNDSQERVDVNEIFNDDDDFGDYQGERLMEKQITAIIVVKNSLAMISRKLHLQQKLTM